MSCGSTSAPKIGATETHVYPSTPLDPTFMPVETYGSGEMWYNGEKQRPSRRCNGGYWPTSKRINSGKYEGAYRYTCDIEPGKSKDPYIKCDTKNGWVPKSVSTIQSFCSDDPKQDVDDLCKKLALAQTKKNPVDGSFEATEESEYTCEYQPQIPCCMNWLPSSKCPPNYCHPSQTCDAYFYAGPDGGGYCQNNPLDTVCGCVAAEEQINLPINRSIKELDALLPDGLKIPGACYPSCSSNNNAYHRTGNLDVCHLNVNICEQIAKIIDGGGNVPTNIKQECKGFINPPHSPPHHSSPPPHHSSPPPHHSSPPHHLSPPPHHSSPPPSHIDWKKYLPMIIAGSVLFIVLLIIVILMFI